MLTLTSGRRTYDCQGYSRRDFLRVGTLALGGLTLPNLLAARQAMAAQGSYVRDRSVIFLYLRGGATQFETFDPKMTAPAEYRAMFGETKTSIPGVTIGHHFAKLAAMADKLAIVRSFKIGSGNHGTGRNLITGGGNPFDASMGALYARLAGSTHPESGMPSNAVVTPISVGRQYSALRNDVTEAMRTGSFPDEFKAFDPGAGASGNGKKQGSGLIADMQLRLPEERLGDRQSLLSQLGNLRRRLDDSRAVESVDKFRQQAFDVVLGGVTDAFNLSKEDPRVVARYDTSKFAVPRSVLGKGTKNAKKIPEFSPVALGKQLLMARRLCDAGCGFVTVTSSGWDMHGNAFGINDGMPCLGPAVDHAVSALLEDLEQRGRSENVLLVIAGEMGRTPKINSKGGRDHWASLSPLALAGGGLNMGQVIGASSPNGGEPATELFTVSNLLATIMHTVLDVGTFRVARGVPADLTKLIENGKPITGLIA